MKSSWFKMYRSIIDWEWFKEHDMTCFFLYCLSKANTADKMWRGTMVRRGQLLVSRSTVCRELGIEERRYRTILSRMIKSGEIEVETSSTNTLITVVNWESYQAEYLDEAEEQRPITGQVETRDRPNDMTGVCAPTHTDTDKKQCTHDNAASSAQKSEEGLLDLFFESDAEGASQMPKKKKREVDCDFIVRLYHDRCPSLPKIIKITDKRKTRIRLWIEDVKDYEKVQEIFDRSEASRFLRGDNNRGWKADFDWITNKTNWVKILEGKYDDKDMNLYSHAHETQYQDRYARRRGADSAARTAEDYSDTL